MSDPALIGLWWARLTNLDRQRVRQFRRCTRLPNDIVESYADVVGGILITRFESKSGTFDMPAPLIEFLDGGLI